MMQIRLRTQAGVVLYLSSLCFSAAAARLGSFGSGTVPATTYQEKYSPAQFGAGIDIATLDAIVGFDVNVQGVATVSAHAELLRAVATARNSLKRKGLSPIQALSSLPTDSSIAADIPSTQRWSTAAVLKAAAAPSSFDVRTASAFNTLCPVVNQGACGSCAAFSATAAAENAYYLARGQPCSRAMSQQHMFFCAGPADGHTCASGWDVGSPITIATTQGMRWASCYPYDQSNRTCTSSACTASSTAVQGRFTVRSIGDLATAKAIIASGGTISTYFNLYMDFYNSFTRGSIYKYDGVAAGAGGHAVLIVGYNDEQRYWLARNSWGPDWGEGGYFKISYADTSIMQPGRYWSMMAWTWSGPTDSQQAALPSPPAPSLQLPPPVPTPLSPPPPSPSPQPPPPPPPLPPSVTEPVPSPAATPSTKPVSMPNTTPTTSPRPLPRMPPHPKPAEDTLTATCSVTLWESYAKLGEKSPSLTLASLNAVNPYVPTCYTIANLGLIGWAVRVTSATLQCICNSSTCEAMLASTTVSLSAWSNAFPAVTNSTIKLSYSLNSSSDCKGRNCSVQLDMSSAAIGPKAFKKSRSVALCFNQQNFAPNHSAANDTKGSSGSTSHAPARLEDERQLLVREKPLLTVKGSIVQRLVRTG